MAVGVYFTFRVLNISDLTVDGSLATGGAVCVMLLRGGMDVGQAMVISFIVGMCAGFITGILHTKMGIPAILAGILTQLGLYSINLRIMGDKANQPISVDKYNLLVSQRYVNELSLRNPILVLLLLTAVLITLLYCFFGTEKGCGLRATGCNVGMARAQGINTDNNIVLGLAIANGFVALGGALIAQYQGAADVNMGRGAIVIGLAAIIISEVLLGKVFHNMGLRMFAVSIGAILYYMVIQVVLKLGLNTNDLKLLSAGVVAIFLAIPYWNKKLAGKLRRHGGSQHA